MFIDFLGTPENFVGNAERYSTELPTSPSITPDLWLDASDVSTVNVTGTLVDSWEDKGSLGLTMTAGGAQQWVYDPATQTLGGLPCLYFNTADVAYLGSNLGVAFTGTLCTAYAVVELESASLTSSVRTLLSMAVNDSTTDTSNINAASIIAKTNISTSSFGGYRNNLDSGRYTVAANTPFIAATRYDNSVARSYKNNVVGSTVPAAVGAFNTGHLRVGNRPTGVATHQIFGKIAEVMLFFNDTHSNDELLHNYQYLARKWGFL